MIVASLLQAEAAPADFGKVARVIYNRLEADMPLQFDSTVSYALGVTKLQLSEEQLKTPSPYNTYLRRGLPPRPINSPGEAAIEAALSPPKGKWLYFVLIDPASRETKFAKTYDEFLKLKKQYQQNLSSFEKQTPSPTPTPDAEWLSPDGPRSSGRRSPTRCRRRCTGLPTPASAWTGPTTRSR